MKQELVLTRSHKATKKNNATFWTSNEIFSRFAAKPQRKGGLLMTSRDHRELTENEIGKIIVDCAVRLTRR
jgi:hypothetical protein